MWDWRLAHLPGRSNDFDYSKYRILQKEVPLTNPNLFVLYSEGPH